MTTQRRRVSQTKMAGRATEHSPQRDDSDVISHVSLWRRRPLLLSGQVAPFAVLWAAWAAWAGAGGGASDMRWWGAVAVLGLSQILCFLACHWSIAARCVLTCAQEPDPWKATLARVMPTANNGSAELVPLQRVKESEEEEEEEERERERIFFIFQKVKYIWTPDSHNSQNGRFLPLDYPTSLRLSDYLLSRGHQEQGIIERAARKYGSNLLQMDIPEFMELFKERATAPFFVFQVFCVGLWCLDEYWYYSIFTLCMLIIFECTLVQQQLRNMAEIRRMGAKPYTVQVYRSRRWRPILTTALVPGDIISVTRSSSSSSSSNSTATTITTTNDCLVPCDLLLLRGSCVVDESMLTGESIPQMKEGISGPDDPRIVTDSQDSRLLDLTTDSKLHVLYGGTKIVQHTPPIKTTTGLRAPDSGCVCYVLRTGFATAQGRLLKTILYGVSRATANSLETLAFILFLLVFAVAAAAYVWVKGTADPERSRYKLFLECTLILTSVVPPELPIELSLAVNTSLLSLSKLCVFCTEPFRIPLAGKIDVTCFDKTGTLTSSDLLVEGLAGLGTSEIVPLNEAPPDSIQVVAACHSLVQLEEGLVGDPQEKATLAAIDWMLTKGDSSGAAVVPRKGKMAGLRIIQRHHFTAQLKRMAVVAGFTTLSGEVSYISAVKGAPETIREMLHTVPPGYDNTYKTLSKRGARVLALGRKELGRLAHAEVRSLTRGDLESDLTFAGFIIISCPLKRDSKEVIREILHSSHAAVILTGDNYLTACHVANELKFTQKSAILVLQAKEQTGEELSENLSDRERQWAWQDLDGSLSLSISLAEVGLDMALKKYDLCVTGEGLSYLHTAHPSLLKTLLPAVRIFARVAPKQKELVITLYKDLKFTTLMCGDGTNDVGALKHAHCGVAILSGAPDRPSSGVRRVRQAERQAERQTERLTDRRGRRNPGGKSSVNTTSQNSPLLTPQQEQMAKLQKLLQELEQDSNLIVKLGDASIAAPFTSKLSSIQCVCHIIKQGRCTLVTTLQMFKILALNALILAYSQSVLYLDGIKFSDYQATLQGLLLAGCFLFISRSKPLPELSRTRPLPNIFNLYTISTVLLQFASHFWCLVYLVSLANDISPKRSGAVELEKEFEPNLINSTVYIISLSLQISTFAINYRGRPFMESLRENKPLLYCLTCAFSLVICLTVGIVPEFSRQFEIIEFPGEFQVTLLKVLTADFSLSLAADRLCLALFGEGSLPAPLTHASL